METAATELSSSTEDWGVRVKSAHDRAAAARERVERGRERRARSMREGRPDRQGRTGRRRLDQRTQTTDSRSAVCSSVNAGVSDAWCSKNCNAPLPNCPDGVCSCEAKEQQQPEPSPAQDADPSQLLQGVRDREAERRRERDRDSSRYEPVDKDW